MASRPYKVLLESMRLTRRKLALADIHWPTMGLNGTFDKGNMVYVHIGVSNWA